MSPATRHASTQHLRQLEAPTTRSAGDASPFLLQQNDLLNLARTWRLLVVRPKARNLLGSWALEFN